MTATTGNRVQANRSNLLRNVLRANAIFSILSGGLLLVASTGAAVFLGIEKASVFGILDGPAFILILGIGVLLFGLGVLYDATRPELNRRDAALILAGDIAWVVISAVLLLTRALPFSTAGNWAVLIAGDIVTVFAIAEYAGLRRLRRSE